MSCSLKMEDPESVEDERLTPPQQLFNEMLSSRGYSVKTFSAYDRGYHTKPTPLQLASYGTAVVESVQKADDAALSDLLWSGLSPNPTNSISEGILGMAIKQGGNYDLFQCQVEAGATVHVADDFGRTPLHHAAWAAKPDFRTAECLISIDRNMLRVTDQMGKTPLEYIAEENWLEWSTVLQELMDAYWPQKEVGANVADDIPHVVRTNGTASIPDPANALPIELAKQVASGAIHPTELKKMRSSRNQAGLETKEAPQVPRLASAGQTSLLPSETDSRHEKILDKTTSIMKPSEGEAMAMLNEFVAEAASKKLAAVKTNSKEIAVPMGVPAAKKRRRAPSIKRSIASRCA